MKQLRLIFASFLILFMGGMFSEVSAADHYETYQGVKYRVEGAYAYVVDLPSVNEVSIPDRFVGSDRELYFVSGFDRGVRLREFTHVTHLKLPEVRDGFKFNGADLSMVYITDITWTDKLGSLDSNTKLRVINSKVYYTNYDSYTLHNAENYTARGITVVPLTLLNGDAGEGYYYSSDYFDNAASVVSLTGNLDNIVIPATKTDKAGVTHTVMNFGLPDVDITNTTATSITFEGTITLYGSLKGLTNLKKVTFAEIGTIDNICSLNGKLTENESLEEIYFTGNTLPNLAGAATDYVCHPENVTVYVTQAACSGLTNLKMQDVWKAFKDVRYITNTATYTLNIEAHNSWGRLSNNQKVYDGKSYSGELGVNTSVGLYARQSYGDYTLTHCFVDGQDVLSQMTQQTMEDIDYYYYLFDDGNSHNVRLEGEALHTVFSQMTLHQSGEGTTTVIATMTDNSTLQLNLPQGTDYDILNAPSASLQQVQLRIMPDNPGQPKVYNGAQQIDVQLNNSDHYYYTTLTLSQLQAGDFAVVHPVTYTQQEGTVKTTVTVRNYPYDVTYDFNTTGDTQHTGTVADNTSEDVYHKWASNGTYTITVVADNQSGFRIQENGADVTNLAAANANENSFTYTIQHPDQNGTIIVDDGCDIRMSMTANTAGIASFSYTDLNNGTQTKNFGKGQEIYAVSSKNRTDQELIVTTDVGFTLYRNGVDISDQYASSNVNATDATKRDYHFHAYGDHNALNFVDGETLSLVLLSAQAIPVMAQSNTKDSRGIKIETFRFDGENNVDEATLHTWGSIASAPVGNYEYLKVYFYHTADESFKELYINGKKYTGGYESDYKGEPESTADCFAMRFQGVGSTTTSGDYTTLNLEALFTSETGLDPTKANAVVSMSDESKQAFAEMTYDIHPQYGSETSKKETMRRGLKTFVMENDQLDNNSFMEYVVYAPEGYEAKVYVEGEDYTNRLTGSTSTTRVNGIDYYTVTLRFDSQLMPQYRKQNTSWFVTVTKSITEARKWNVALLGDKTRTNVSFYDELNANKDYYERENCGSSGDITANSTINVPFNAETASFIVEFSNEYDLNTGGPLYNLNDYDLVVKADGQDVSDQFDYNGESAYVNYNLNPELLSATDWIVGFKAKGSTVVTHTATMTGDIGTNQVTLELEGNTSCTLSSETPNATITTTAQPTACCATVTLQNGYTFKAFFNGWEVTGFTKSADGTYTASEAAPALNDGSWVFEFTKKPIEIIEFADANVKAICVTYWDTDHDGELSKEEAAAVTTLSVADKQHSAFYDNNEITSFDELQYFTGLIQIPNFAFCRCSNLTSIVLPNTITAIGSNAFAYCHLGRVDLPESLEELGSSAFIYTWIETLYIPKNVRTIGTGLFSGCNSLTSVTVATSNTTFNSKNGCNAIIKTNDNALLAGCKNTVIPEDVVSIVEGAFANNAQLKKIVIPATVTTIGNSAFNTCYGLKSVACKSTTPATIGTSAFLNVSVGQCKLYVPMGTKQAYIDAGWTETIFTGGIIEESEYDLNNDNKVTITDAVRMLDIILHGQ